MFSKDEGFLLDLRPRAFIQNQNHFEPLGGGVGGGGGGVMGIFFFFNFFFFTSHRVVPWKIGVKKKERGF